MRTIDGYASRSTSFRQRIHRDIQLLARIAQMLYGYLVTGRRIRQAYRAKEARGEVFLVDEEMPS